MAMTFYMCVPSDFSDVHLACEEISGLHTHKVIMSASRATDSLTTSALVKKTQVFLSYF